MASSRRIARETRGRGPQTVGRATKCTAPRERTATRGTGPTAQCRATLVRCKTPVLRSDFSPTPRPRRRTSPNSRGRILSYRSRPPPVAPRGTFSTPVDAPVEFDRGVTASEIWEHGATALRSQLAPNTWGLWFQGVRAVSLTDDVLTLAVPSSLAADRIRSSYTGMLADTLRDITGQQLRVELTVETDTRPDEALPAAPPTV